MNKFKKYNIDINLLTAVALVLLVISEAPVQDSLTAMMLYINIFSNILITIILLILYIRMRKKVNTVVARIILTVLFVSAFIMGLHTVYETFIKILNFW